MPRKKEENCKGQNAEIEGKIKRIEEKKFKGKKVYHVWLKQFCIPLIFISKAIDELETLNLQAGDKISIDKVWTHKNIDSMKFILIGKETTISKIN
jgi:hypothetical protein